MLGAIIGDILGSVFEGSEIKEKNVPFYLKGTRMTDDSMMTIAVGCACARSDLSNEQSFKETVVLCMREIGNKNPYAGYGWSFMKWLDNPNAGAYNSFGNGSAMRVSTVSWFASSLEEAERLAKWSAEVTHNHPEGIKGAKAIAGAVFLARSNKTKEEIRKYIEDNYYSLDFTLDEIRPSYNFSLACQESVPQSIKCFLEADSYEDAIRNAISMGGDADTMGAMAGAIAEPFFGIPRELIEKAFSYMKEENRAYFNEYARIVYKDQWFIK